MYHRFNHAGWTHGSIAQRNILVQRGPLTVAPFYRALQALNALENGGELEHSFRLIDFGRSAPMDERGAGRMRERSDVKELFGFTHRF